MEWDSTLRWKGIKRPYTREDVNKVRGSIMVEHTLAKLGAEKLWARLNDGHDESTKVGRKAAWDEMIEREVQKRLAEMAAK